MTSFLNDVTGFRGEKLVELCLTEYSTLPAPLFRPGFLGDKWPALDFYVELTSSIGSGMYFFGQAKATTGKLTKRSKVLKISSDLDDVERLRKIPAPTYIFGIHEPSKRVFARCVHASTPSKAITSIPLANELTLAKLQTLHDEIVSHWTKNTSKPTSSAFA
jgi:Ni,Fe-hydrogenase I large subunit